MDQYFDQMEKVIEKRKISSRIKFALKDVIDLRGCNWVPRRDDANPKTIDQIHREAQQKEKESEQARQQDKLQRKLEPKGGGRGGRDSPSVRGAPGGGSGGTSDGWSTVSSANKSRQMPTAPLDPNKFRGIIKKTDTSEISLGPGGRAGAWSKGASGGVSSRSGSGSNTPTGEIDQGRNRYDLLTDSAVAPGSLDGKRGSGGRSGMTPRKGMSGGHGSQQGNRRDRDEQNAALRAVRDMTGHHRNQSPGRGSRNQSPAPPFERDTSSPRGQTPVVSPNPTVTQDKMRKVTKSTVEEYLSCKDDKEAMLCLTELQSPGLHNIFVEEAVMIVIEKKPEHRRIVGALIHRMLKESLLNASQVCQGLTAIVDLAPDFAVDIPHIYKYVGEILSPIVYDGTLPLNKVKDTLEPLIQKNKAGIVMAEALSGAVQIAGKEELITTLWSNSKVTWEALLASDENVQQFLKDKKMEFTLKTSHPSSHSQSSNLSHATQIQEEMLRIINDSQRHENNNDNADLISYIEQNISPSEKKTSSFIQVLTTAVCSSSINKDSNCECNKELLSKRKNVLLKYIDRSKDLELQALFAIQLLVHELKQPRGLLRDLFDVLYEGDIITEDAFFNWETSKESPLGKGHALSSVKDFLSWLKKADEESNDEESSTSPTNVA
jgi:translation initiation factor 4G